MRTARPTSLQQQTRVTAAAIRRFLLPAIAAAGLAAAACGGSSTSPVAPSGGGAQGATVSGTIRSGAATLAVTTGAAGQGVQVTVVGTTLVSGLDGAGRFSLSGVPAGNIVLRFAGAGVDATLPLAQVGGSDAIELTVNLAGSFATLEAERRVTAGDVIIEGRVESIPPTMPAGAVRVSGAAVHTNAQTRIEKGGEVRPFTDLEVGTRVHIVATTSGSEFVARVITVQNTNTSVGTSVNGIIDSLAGTAAGFSFRIGSQVIHGDILTEFFGNGGSDSFAALADGARVEVKGQLRDGFVYAARLHINQPAGTSEDDEEDEQDEDGQDSSASIHGVLTAIGGGGETLVLTVGGTTVRTTAGTVVQRRGDVQTLQALQLGMSLHVVGDRQADGSLIARRIQIDDDAVGALVEIEGSAGGVKGACPALSFTVNGYAVATSSSTSFVGLTCAGLKSGTKVVVNGTKQADGSVAATSVKAS